MNLVSCKRYADHLPAVVFDGVAVRREALVSLCEAC